MEFPDLNSFPMTACRLLKRLRIYANQMFRLWVVVALRRTVFLPQLALHYLTPTLDFQGTAVTLLAPCRLPVACRILLTLLKHRFKKVVTGHSPHPIRLQPHRIQLANHLCLKDWTTSDSPGL